ncbi:hypothetical protein LTR47_011791 [Exophiala xenobiotica]|nr:hypothetical protein LTR47_011791 [Exophiala xenobiotica]KAK5242665.1 hypothetical protein LTS06_011375 [Exophiala xenobiotica]KAK5280459.1 hypothetical protein LTR40_006321 [Exophiala xenobiotica]KAK5431415.1 hypothetical protein LTR18_011381 [Exophiala xenobiotica]
MVTVVIDRSSYSAGTRKRQALGVGHLRPVLSTLQSLQTAEKAVQESFAKKHRLSHGPTLVAPQGSTHSFETITFRPRHTNLLESSARFHSNSHLLLSPLDSTTGSATVGGNPTTSSFVYATLPKPFPSKEGSADHFSNAPPSILSSNWTGSGMTVMDHPPRYPPPSSLPLSSSANGIAGAASINSRLVVDRLSHTYQLNGHTSISHDYLQQPTTRFPPGPYSSRNSAGHYSISGNTHSGHSMSISFRENVGAGRQEGPSFGKTNALYHVLNVRNQHLVPEITASIPTRFCQVDHKWTCYRRNFFAVSCSFSFENHGSEGPFYLHRNGQDEQIQQFSVSISTKTALTGNSESESRGLVQYGPKRDTATKTVPGRHLISATPQEMAANGVYAGTVQTYGAQHHMSEAVMGSSGNFFSHNANAIPTTHTFERIQFQKATANNGKRPGQQQYSLLVVELSANVARTPGAEHWVVIATKESEPMVVRGRSPGKYKDNGSRDSQTSMGSDRGSGHVQEDYTSSTTRMIIQTEAESISLSQGVAVLQTASSDSQHSNSSQKRGRGKMSVKQHEHVRKRRRTKE